VEMLKSLTDSFVVHVPYASSPAAVTSVLQGDTHITSLAPLAVMPQVQAGKLKALAVSTAKRSAQLPGVPTLREGGVPMDGSAWIGIVAPAGTPAPVIERLNREFVAALRDPAVVEKLKAQYMEADPGTPAQFAAFMRAELARWTPVIRRSGATIE
jgi:tripartite-type tricarboxylate transporter receptor subunit TctC